MNHSPPTDDAFRNEISIRDLWNVLRVNKYVVLGVALVFAVFAMLGVTLVKPQWEAVSVIQIGQIWQVAAPLKSPTRTVERMKLQPFKASVLSDLGVVVEDGDPRRFVHR